MHRRRPGSGDDRGEPRRLSTVLATAGGIALIVLAFRDVFDVLFHPEGKARISRWVTHATWAVVRRIRPTLAGPLALIAVLATWALLLVLGWALIFWPQLDTGFRTLGGPHEDGFLDAIYVSLVTLTTVGYGDVTPDADALQIVTPLEAMLGFALLTASVSWVLTLYPALSRRRSLAYEISLLQKTERDVGHSLFDDPQTAEPLYADLLSRLIAVERDLIAFPVTHYFREADERFSLSGALPYLREVADRGLRDDAPEAIRVRATMLCEALDDFHESADEP